jgi:hypothetical protein
MLNFALEVVQRERLVGSAGIAQGFVRCSSEGCLAAEKLAAVARMSEVLA